MGIIVFGVLFAVLFLYNYKKNRIVGKKDTILYIIANLVGIVVFTSLNLSIVNSCRGVLFFASVPVLFSIAWYDAKEKQIDMLVLLILLGISILSIINYDVMYPVTHILTAVLFLLIMFIGSKISKNGIGFGDIKLMPVVALLLGLEITLKVTLGALFIMFLVGIISIAKKKVGWKDTLPFAPYVYIAYVLCSI